MSLRLTSLNSVNERILFILLITFIFSRVLFFWFPFWGFEYEDAYIYADTSRYLNANYDWSIDFFKTQSCIDGNAEFCNQSITFGGHHLAFPILISLLSNIIGYYPTNALILNFIISCLIGFVIYRINLKNEIKIVSFILLLITPFISYFQTSGVSEVLSSLFVVSSIFLILKRKKTILFFCLTSVTICFAILTKRENFILIPFFIFYNAFYSKLTKRFLIDALTMLLVGFALFGALGVTDVELNEGDDIGKGTFTIEFLLENGLNNLHSFFTPKFWGITGVLFLISIILHIIKWKNTSINVKALLCIILCYFILYSAHYRSIFQVLYDDLDPFEALRYQTNIFPVITIYIGYIIKELKLKKIPTIPLGIGILLLTIFSAFQRVKFSGFELEERIGPTLNALERSKDGKTFITDLHIIANIYSEGEIQVKDCYTRSINELINESEFPIYILTDKSLNHAKAKTITKYPNGKKFYKIENADK